MKVKIVVAALEDKEPGGLDQFQQRTEETRSVIWEGELDILRDNIYITKISVIGEGEEHPIVDIPFSLDQGWWQWMPAHSNDAGDHFSSLVQKDEKRSYD
jgi:hypothetical protein